MHVFQDRSQVLPEVNRTDCLAGTSPPNIATFRCAASIKPLPRRPHMRRFEDSSAENSSFCDKNDFQNRYFFRRMIIVAF